ncbi:MAG TPA: hypothetical protein PLI43_17280 [Albidovulum sp.]|uniref:hypothetical protein n=1 Tax=Albidovulum sp. TaxID=1872424 RepID=UPI002C85014F|nr:hypothetical protein [Albidovulum sp.]
MISNLFKVLHWLWSVVSIPLAPIGRLVLRVWDAARTFGGVVWSARFSAFTVAAGAALLAMTDQGQELAVAMAVEGRALSQHFLFFLLAVTWFAFQAWYWARVSYLMKYGTAKRAHDWRITHVPRIYAALAYLFAAIAMQMAGSSRLALLTIAVGVVFVLLLIFRLPLARMMSGKGQPDRWAAPPPGGAGMTVGSLGRSNILALLASLIFAAATMLAMTVWPVSIGQLLGPAAVAFLAFGQLIPVGSLLVYWSWKTRIPLVASLLIWAVAISDLADNHAVPLVAGTGAAQVIRPDVQGAAKVWLTKTGPAASAGTARPVVFVSAAGGGVRAAYWTAVVLGTLQADCPGFDQQLFSISGVSGGSVGAAFYQTGLFDGLAADGAVACGAKGPTDAALLARLRAALDDDFLGPTLAAMFYPDLLQRFLPVGLPDRGAALVAAWNAAWRRSCAAGADCAAPKGDLQTSFLEVAGTPGKTERWLPVLALNGTHQETGKRIITSNVAVTTGEFLDAFDLLDLIGGDVPIGVAALNSARFTYVSPAGLLVNASGTKTFGHVLDGGYFENNGAVTTAEIARAAVEAFEDEKVPVRPIFIQISSDPDLDWRDAPVREGYPRFQPFAGSQRSCWYWLGQRALNFLGLRDVELPKDRTNCMGNEIAGPLRGILNTRTARGVLADKTVAKIVGDLGEDQFRFPAAVAPVFAHFRMCAPEGGNKPPLGWAMAAKTYDFIGNDLIRRRCGDHDNAAALRTVLDALRNPLRVTCAEDAADSVLRCRTRPSG